MSQCSICKKFWMLLVELGAEYTTRVAAITKPVIVPLLLHALVFNQIFSNLVSHYFLYVTIFYFNSCIISCHSWKYFILTVHIKILHGLPQSNALVICTLASFHHLYLSKVLTCYQGTDVLFFYFQFCCPSKTMTLLPNVIYVCQELVSTEFFYSGICSDVNNEEDKLRVTFLRICNHDKTMCQIYKWAK